jgi:hypothetical protein
MNRVCETLTLFSIIDTLHGEARPNPEAERKFQMWTATTIGLLLDSVDTKPGSNAHKSFEKTKSVLVKDITEVIYPLRRNSGEGFTQQLHAILDAAFSLDLEFSRQVATMLWVFDNEGPAGGKFDPSKMELEKGEAHSKRCQEVRLVVAPALKKRGKSTGEDFGVESTLVKMEVSCEPARHRR